VNVKLQKAKILKLLIFHQDIKFVKGTKSISKVRHGDSFFVSFIFTDFAFVDTLRALRVFVTLSARNSR